MSGQTVNKTARTSAFNPIQTNRLPGQREIVLVISRREVCDVT